MLEHRRARVADRENEYKAERRKRARLSPERADPFADGKSANGSKSHIPLL